MATYDKFLDSAPQGGGGRYDQFLDPQEGDLSRGFRQGMLGLKGAVGGLFALLGKGVGSEGLTNYGLDVYKGAEERSQELARPTDSLAGIGGFGDALDFAQHSLGVAAPSIIASIASGGVGALLGRELAKRGAIALAQQAATKVGGIAGAAAGSIAPEVGSIYPEALQEGVSNPELRALGGGALAGSLDILPLLRAANRTGLIGKMAREAVPETMLGKAGMVAKELGKQAGVEGGTEGLQTIIERAAAGKALDTPEAIQEVLDSAAGGAIAGGGMGIPGAAMRLRQQPEVTPQSDLNRDAGPISRGLVDNGIPALPVPTGPLSKVVPGQGESDEQDAERTQARADEVYAARAVEEARQASLATPALPAPTEPLSKVVPGQSVADQEAAQTQARADEVYAARAAEDARQASLRDLEARIAAERASVAADREAAFSQAERDQAAQRMNAEQWMTAYADAQFARDEAVSRPAIPPNNAIAEAFARRQAQSAAAPVSPARAVAQPAPKQAPMSTGVALPEVARDGTAEGLFGRPVNVLTLDELVLAQRVGQPQARRIAEAELNRREKDFPQEARPSTLIERQTKQTRELQDTDSLLPAIAKLGGLDREQAIGTWGLDPQDFRRQTYAGMPVLRKKGGVSLDEMAARLVERGYLQARDLQEFESLFSDEASGARRHFNPRGADAAAAQHMAEQAEFAQQEAEFDANQIADVNAELASLPSEAALPVVPPAPVAPTATPAVPANAPAMLKGQARLMAASATRQGTPSEVVPHPVEPGKFAVVPKAQPQSAAPAAQTPAASVPAEISPATVPALDIAPPATATDRQGEATISPVLSPNGTAEVAAPDAVAPRIADKGRAAQRRANKARARAEEDAPRTRRPRLSTAEPTTPKGQQTRQWLADRPDVTVVDRQDELPSGGTPIKSGTRIDGMYDPATGKVYVVAEHIPHEARARWVAAHEGGHKGFDALDKATNGEAGKRLTMLRNNRTVQQIAGKIGAERGATDQKLNLEEALAEVIAASETGNFDALRGRYGVSADQLSLTRNVVQRFMDWLRTWFQQRGATDADVKRLMRDIIAESRQGRAEGDARLSTVPSTINVDGKQRPTTNSQGKPIAPDEESIRNFWRWFSDSTVVDGRGRPLVVHHGTRNEISTFRVGSEGRPERRVLFFTDSLRDAKEFSYFKSGGSPRVMQLYVRISNPLEVNAKGELFYPGQMDEWINEAMAGDRDGLEVRRIQNFEGAEESTTYIAFAADQVKSATGNAGSFDATNPDIRYSTVGDAVDYLRAPQTTRGMVDAIRNLFDTHGTFNVLNKTVGTQFHKAWKDSLFKRVFDAVQNQLTDVSHYALEAEALAPDVLLPVKNRGDVWKAVKAGTPKWLGGSGEYRQDLEAIAKPLFANIEGVEGVQQRVFTPAELKADFGLTDRQVKMYQQYRDAIDASLDRLGQSLLMRMGRVLGMDVAGYKNTSMSDTADELRAAMNLRIQSAEDRVKAAQEQLASAQQQLPGLNNRQSITMDERGNLTQRKLKDDSVQKAQKAVDDAIAEVKGLQNSLREINQVSGTIKDLQDKGYTPAMRFGRYAVTAYEPGNPKTRFFNMYDSRVKANLVADKLRRNNPSWNVTQGVINDKEYELFQKVPPDMAELFGRFMGLEENEAFKQYIALSASSRSALKRQLDREGTAGFSEDVVRVLASFITSNARAASSNIHGGEINDALMAIHNYKPKPGEGKRGDVMQEAQELVDYVQNPKEEAPFVRSLMFAHFLGGSMAAGMVNMTQPVLMTAPYLSQFAKAGDLLRIMKLSARIATNGKGASASLQRALSRAQDDGITEPHEIHHLMADSGNSAFSRSLAGRAFVKVWGGFFSLSEAWNRKLTFAAAFQVAEKMTPEQLKEAKAESAYDFAVNAVYETQGIYNKGNRPNWARGPIGATLFTFKQFSVAYMEWLTRLPWKQQVLALGMLSLAAGIEGLPFIDDIEDIVDTVFQKAGFATNSKAWLNRTFASILGDGMAEFALHGFSIMPGVPLDVSARLGLSNLIPGTRALNPSTRDRGSEIMEAIGAPGGFVKSAGKAFAEGKPSEILPKAIKDFYKAFEMFTTGEYKDSSGKKIANVDMMDAIVKGIGFQPADIAGKGRTAGMVQRDIDIQARVERDISGAWARGIVEHNPDDVAQARQRLAEWNADHPELPVRIGLAQIRQRVGEMTRTRDERIIRKAPPEIRQRIAAELQ